MFPTKKYKAFFIILDIKLKYNIYILKYILFLQFTVYINMVNFPKYVYKLSVLYYNR